MSDEIVVIDPEYRLGIIPAKTPHDVIVQATKIAKELADIIRKNNLAVKIRGKEHVRVEGWSTMGAMLGVLPRELPELAKRFDDGSYEAVVELVRISDGAVIGRASALVGMDERDNKGKLTWGDRNEYARKSMSITRATGKAYRLGFSWIMALAGYEVTPAEEFTEGAYKDVTKSQSKSAPQEPSINGNRPYPPHILKAKIAEAVMRYAENEVIAKDGDRGAVIHNLEMCFTGDPNSTACRHAVSNYLTGKPSSQDWNAAEVIALKKWQNAKPDEGGEFHSDPNAVQEAIQINILTLKTEGQQELPEAK